MTNRESCNKIGCGNHATIVLKVYTTEGVNFIGFCTSHFLTISNIVDLLVEQMIGDPERTIKEDDDDDY